MGSVALSYHVALDGMYAQMKWLAGVAVEMCKRVELGIYVFGMKQSVSGVSRTPDIDFGTCI